MSEQPEKTLVKKLSKIMGDIEGVPQTGYNKFHKYNYTTEADVQAITSNQMPKENLIMIPYEVDRVLKEVTTSNGKTENFYQGTWDFNVIDGDSGEELTVRVTGHGQDSGDKAPYKAFTGAHKYALMKLFQISTGDDPERDNTGQQNTQKPKTELISANNVKKINAKVKELSELSDGDDAENVVKYQKWIKGQAKVDNINEIPKKFLSSLLDALDRMIIKAKRDNLKQTNESEQEEQTSLMDGNTTTAKDDGDDK